MSWPRSQDYNEAIQDPCSSFSDAELKGGEAVSNALGIPMPSSGNFADVYEVRCPAGARWAVKCFTREVHGLRERYAEISKYLRQANLPFTVDFQYLEQGIRVRARWFPILKMQWVEGFVLNEFVRDNLDKKPILHALGQIWLRMARRLHQARLAHGDLQHGNVMFVPGSSAKSLAVKLIDYDGMCVPSLSGKNSGEVGHPAYQHPDRLRSGAYNQEVDRFSLLSIAASLRCLTIGGRSLWQRYDNGDNLLFRQSDLQVPAESPLFRELLAIGDPQAQLLVKELYRACQGSLSRVPLLTDLVALEKPVTRTAGTAAAQEVDWDFGDDEPGAPILRKRRATQKSRLWVWGLLGGAAAVLLSVGIGSGLFSRKSSSNGEVAANAPKRLAMKILKKDVKPLADGERPVLPKAEQLAPDDISNKPSAAASKLGRSPRRIFQLTPKGEALALSDEGSKVWRLVDPHTNNLIREFRGHTGSVLAIDFSLDGKLALTAGADKVLRLWDVSSGQVIDSGPTFFDEPDVRIALAPDGKRAACANGSKTVTVWDFANKKVGPWGHPHEVWSVAFSPDGRYLFSGYDKSDPQMGESLHRWNLKPGGAAPSYKGSGGRIYCLAVSPDGKFIAAGQGGDPATVSLWEAATGRLVKQFASTRGPFHRVVFSADSRFLAAAAGNRYQIWPIEAVEKGRMPAMGGGDAAKDRVTVAFAPDNEGVTIAYRKADRVARIHSMPLPKPTVASGKPPTVPSLPVAGAVVEKSSQPLEEADAWSHLVLPRDLKPDAKDPILRIPKGRTVATRQEYNGPLDITMVVRGPQDQDVSFIAPGGARVRFRYNGVGQPHLLDVHRPDQPRGELGTLISPIRSIVLPEKKWCTLHWEITAMGMRVSINKQRLFREAVRYELTAKYPVKIRVNAETVEVKSVVVKTLKK